MKKKLCILLLWVSILHAVGILVFLSGFLLKRTVLSEVSICENGAEKNGCLLPKRYKRAVILLIDALRFDFVEMDPDPDSLLPFKNKLPIVEDTLRKSPRNSRLFKFVADPPTTTMQRLKGLTTGSLPTFVDAGSNFASASITEDNWLLQARNLGRKLCFMGDDTWMQLFPDSFAEKWPFPSLNVKDLHTVDNGVLEHLMPEIRSEKWDILIGHFLGVDHCGHRFGPYHPAIGDKLQQMNNVIQDVMAEVDEDTILLVFGDHGMTRSGDHGGDSVLETSSALFLYSPTPIAGNIQHTGQFKTVSQIDLVPSLSLLLGMPIPFNNLGRVIPDLFPGARPSDQPSGAVHTSTAHVEPDVLLLALMENAKQVDRYLRTYSAVSSDLPRENLELLSEHFRVLSKNFTFLSTANRDVLVESFQSYLTRAQSLCRQVWARFDVPRMLLGLAHLVCAAVITLLLGMLSHCSCEGGHIFFQHLSLSLLQRWLFVSTSLVSASSLVLLQWLSGDLTPLSVLLSLLLALSIGVVSLLTVLVHSRRHSADLYRAAPLNRLPDLIAALGLTAHALAFVSNSFIVQEDSLLLALGQVLTLSVHWLADRSSSTGTAVATKYLALSLVLCRVAVIFRGCREEQAWCLPSTFLLHFSTSFAHLGFPLAMFRLLLSCCVTALLPLAVLKAFVWRQFAQWKAITCLAFIASVCVCGHFCVQSLPLDILDGLPGWQHVMFPRVVYIVVVVSFIMVYLNNRTVTGCHLPGLYIVLTFVWLLVAILIGDGLVFAASLTMVEIVVISHYLSFFQANIFSKSVLWAILAGQLYFATGHQYDLPSIRFDAAFVGLYGDQQDFLVAGALVVTNMFASQILFTLALPLVASARSSAETSVKGTSTSSLLCDAVSALFFHLAYYSFTLVAAVVAATVLRRHLMVWKIFAPRLLYASFITELVCLCSCIAVSLLPASVPMIQKHGRKSSEPAHSQPSTSHSL